MYRLNNNTYQSRRGEKNFKREEEMEKILSRIPHENSKSRNRFPSFQIRIIPTVFPWGDGHGDRLATRGKTIARHNHTLQIRQRGVRTR